jgi:hypothetical protein
MIIYAVFLLVFFGLTLVIIRGWRGARRDRAPGTSEMDVDAGFPSPRQRFIGGVNLAEPWGRFRRFNATVPLGFLKISPGSAELMGLPSTLMPKVSLRAERTQVFRSRGILMWGVGFRTGANVNYFWSFTPLKVLRVLQQCGFAVTGDEHPTFSDLLGL